MRGGTIAGNLLGVFFVPLFFVVVWRIFSRDGGKPVATEPPIDA